MRDCFEWDDLVTLAQATSWDPDGAFHHLETCEDCRLRIKSLLGIRAVLVPEGQPDSIVADRIADAVLAARLASVPSSVPSVVVASLTMAAGAAVLLLWGRTVTDLQYSWPIVAVVAGLAAVAGGTGIWRRTPLMELGGASPEADALK